MKVLHLGKFYPPARGGMETILELICTQTAGEIQNEVLVANDRCASADERHGAVHVMRVPALARIGAVAICPTLPFRLASQRPDLIVIHEPNPMGLLAYFLARPPGTVIVWFHSEVVRPSWRYALFYRPLLKFALGRAARIVVSSPTLAASAAQLQPWIDKCTVIPFGIQQNRESQNGNATRAAAPVTGPAPGRNVLFVGRLVPYKGVDVLLDAMAGLPATAQIVGVGPERMRLEERARALGVDDRVKFLGEVSAGDLAALYDACDLFVLPSVTRQEAFGVVLLEAMARGKPVVSTELGTGTSWVNQHGRTGLVVPPRDARALHGALDRLLNDAALRAAMGRAALERVQTTFATDTMIRSVLGLYEEAAGGRTGRAA